MTRQNESVSPEIAAAAVTLLVPYFPGLTPAILVDALKNHANTTLETCARPQKPYTRKQAAALLQMSMATLDRYLASGRLARIRLSAHATRVSAESVHNLMKGGEII